MKSSWSKIILITGASDGLGLATAKALSTEHTVVALARDKEKLEDLKKYYGIDYVIADVTKESEVEKAIKTIIKKYVRIDVLINNAGLWIEGKLEDNSVENIKKVLEVNTLGPIIVSQKVLPFMKSVKGGRIINIVSQAGLYAKAERSVYRASKFGLRGFSESLTLELAPYGIAVCSFYPDKMNTKFFAKGGDSVNTKNFINVEESVRCLKFLVETPDDINIPELGIKKLNQY